MLLGELTAAFPWGVLLVTDDASSEQIPPGRLRTSRSRLVIARLSSASCMDKRARLQSGSGVFMGRLKAAKPSADFYRSLAELFGSPMH